MGRVKLDRAIVIGDLLVRRTDKRFYGNKHGSRMACDLPGAKVQDVLQWL